MRRLRTTLKSVLLTSTVASGCTYSHVQTAPLPDTLPVGRRGQLLVTLKVGGVMPVYNATVLGDTLVGVSTNKADSVRVAIAVSDIESVAVTRVSVARTIVAMVLGTVAAVSIVIVAACASLSNSLA